MSETQIKTELNNPQIKIESNSEKYLLPEKSIEKISQKTLVLDLDETLLHCQFMPFNSTKNQISLECILDKINRTIYVKLRPGVKEFIKKMVKLYEIVIFTASTEEYANQLINLIFEEKKNLIHKLYREHCTLKDAIYIKDLNKLGRDLSDIIIIDNSPNSYSYHKENGIPIKTWFDDDSDRELFNLIQILEFLSWVDDVRFFIPKFVINNEISYLASNDIIRKYKNKNGKNSNLSAINIRPYFNDSLVNNIINNNKSNIEEKKEETKGNDSDKKEKELIDISENLFDDCILNENINKTDFDINLMNDESLLKSEKKDKNNNKNNDINKKNKEISNIKDNKENKREVSKNKSNKEKSINKKPKNNLSKIDINNNKAKSRSKANTLYKKSQKSKIIHNKSSSYSNVNTISNFKLTMQNDSKSNIKNKNSNLSKTRNDDNNLSLKNIKSKTVKRAKKINLVKKFYHPRNIITEFKPLKTLNNDSKTEIKNQSKLITNTPKKVKQSDKNKIKNRILKQIKENKENKENKKEKIEQKKEEKPKIKNLNEQQNLVNMNSYSYFPTLNKKELIKQRKKTPFRMKKKKGIKDNKKEQDKNKDNINSTDKEKVNNIINYKNKIINTELASKKESDKSLLEKNNLQTLNKTINNTKINHKTSKSFKIKNINRLPWGYGGYTIKLSDIDNVFNYNVESREIRIAKLDIFSYKRAKSFKLKKNDKEKIRTNKEPKDNNKNNKIKRGKSTPCSTNISINKKHEEK